MNQYLDPDDYRMTYFTDDPSSIVIVLNSDNDKLCELLNNALEELRSSGELEALVMEYFGTDACLYDSLPIDYD